MVDHRLEYPIHLVQQAVLVFLIRLQVHRQQVVHQEHIYLHLHLPRSTLHKVNSHHDVHINHIAFVVEVGLFER